jgi:hypothetical protein
MLTPCLVAGLLVLGQPPAVEPAHAKNAVYGAVLGEGLTFDGQHAALPAPALRDGMSGPEQREALVKVVGSAARLDELLRDSVTAPFVLKPDDAATKAGDVVRRGALYFCVHAPFEDIDPDALNAQRAESKPVEAGNMRFTTHVVKGPDDAKGEKGDAREAVVHVDGRLLGRIAVEATNRVTATRSDESWVVASRTDPSFDRDAKFPNRWRPLGGKGAGAGAEDGGPAAKPFAGGGSYVKVSKLAAPAGALFVEAHFAFEEPRAWFDGAPILRSKFSVVAQDQIRRLRRELAGRKSKTKSQ